MARPKKKIARFKIVEFTNAAGTKSWRVTGTRHTNERVRKNFTDWHQANQEMADLESEAPGHVVEQRSIRTRLSSVELADAEAAVGVAQGKKLSSIVTHYMHLEERARAKGVTLDAALSFVESNFRSEITEMTIFQAAAAFVDTRLGGTQKTKSHYEATLRMLMKPDPNKLVTRFTVTDIEKVLSGYTNLNSRRTYRRTFSVFFNWAHRHHYCLENPCKRLDKIPKDMSQIVALSFEESKRLLYAAVCIQEAASAATIAIGLFAGLRPSEIKDLKPEDIGEKVIRVSGGKLRRTLKRTVPIPPVLAAWLKKYPFTGLPGGWDYKMKALKKATKAKKWVQDIIRHTSITFQTERDKNEALTAYNCGTSIQMMNQHYRNTIDDEKTIIGFWDLTPTKLMAKKPKVDLPNKPKVSWPEKKALLKLVWEKPLIHAAAEIGVSDVALKKHCIKLGLTLPPRGHWIRK